MTSFAKVQLKSVMTKNPLTVEPHLRLRDAMKRMRDLKVTHLPVLAEGKLIGILSERDLLAVMGIHGDQDHLQDHLQVKDVMISDPVTFPEGALIPDVAKKMVDEHIGSVLVVDDRKKLIGIFTYTDALKMLAADR